MEERIIEMLKASKNALTVYEINDALGFKTVDELKELLKVLNKMEDSLQIYRSKKDGYLLFTNSHLKIGTLSTNKRGFGFVIIEGSEDVFIAPSNLNNAIHGDKVMVEITSKKGMDLEGRIMKIVERNLQQMVGEFYYSKGMGYVDLDNDKVKIKVQIEKNKSMGAMNGHKVLVKITNKLKDNNYNGEVIKILGHKNDPGVDILSIVCEYGIPSTYSDEVMKELESIPSELQPNDYNDRRDLRSETIFTIDGDDTKDFDQAHHIKKLDNGNYLLGVHIADVSHYVKEGSALWKEAFDRGTSVYLADRVINMFPQKLSNGITSLDEGVDRLTVSCDMEINHKGDVVKYDIYLAVINSKKKMTYANVNKIIEQNTMVEGYEPYVEDLKMMAELAGILRKNRISKGYLDFDTDEMRIHVDENGKPTSISKRYRGTSEGIIEHLMIATNETIATYFHYLEEPFIYRVHETPDIKDVEEFLLLINTLGYPIDSKIRKVDGRSFQKILDTLKSKDEWLVLSSLTLRTMRKAKYSPDNLGHFGLGLEYYGHFTAPNRRWPDFMVQNQLKAILGIPGYRKHTYEELVIHGDQSSKTEERFVKCGRDVDKMKSAEYMEGFVGTEFNGMISGVVSFGLFVELDNLIEGLVRLDDLTGDKYFFDEAAFAIRSENNKRGYRLGDKVRVVVKAASKENRTIDFILVEPKEEETK